MYGLLIGAGAALTAYLMSTRTERALAEKERADAEQRWKDSETQRLWKKAMARKARGLGLKG